MKRLRCPHCGELTDLLIPICGDYECCECKRWFRIGATAEEAIEIFKFRDNLRQEAANLAK